MNIELADVFHRFGGTYHKKFAKSMLPSHKKAMCDIAACRTATLGGHVYRCEDCGQSVYVYHACRNRHCPACHTDQIKRWLDDRMCELLPCDYFHVTFTVPQTLRSVCRSNQKLMYKLIMKTAADCIVQLTGDKKYLSGQVGILAVLHTWSNDLNYHPHVHLLVTGGGIDHNGQWIKCKNKFHVPVKALSKLFRGKFRARLKKQAAELFESVDPDTWSTDWVVHSLHYGCGQTAVLQYLSRYVFRIAITNRRILAMDDTHVTFNYKDRKADKWRTSKLTGEEFIRRFLQHVLPKGFHKVRYYGLWHPSSRNNVRKLLNRFVLAIILANAISDGESSPLTQLQNESLENVQPDENKPRHHCPHCGCENLIWLKELPRPRMRSP